MNIRKAAERLKRKLAGRGGFTISELLVCIIIILLVGEIITQTLDLGIRQFKERTLDSDANLLCNTLAVAVQERLSYAYEYKVDADGNVESFKTGADEYSDMDCTFDNNTDGYYVQLRYNEGSKSYKIPLVSEGNYVLDEAGKATLKAAVNVKYAGNDTFTVRITVSDTSDNERTSKTFQVTSVRAVVTPTSVPTP